MKVTEARKLAQKSTQYGYYDHGDTLVVNCPLRQFGNCPDQVSVAYSMWATDGKGKRLSKIGQLRQAVFEHLQDEH